MADFDTTNISDNPVEEGELAETQVEAVGNGSAAADSFLDLSGLINSHIKQLDGFREKMGKLRDMLNSIYENDPTYQEHDKAVKEAQKVRNATKKQIQKLPQAADLANQINDIKAQMKDYSDQLSEYITQYAETTGSRVIEGDDGQLREIIYKAHLVKKS